MAQWGAALGVPKTAEPLPLHRAATGPVASTLGLVLGAVTPVLAPPRPTLDHSATPPLAPATPQPPRPGADPLTARCAAARRDVERAGLVLPDRFEFRCPGSTELYPGGRQHWGVTCSYASLCPGGAYVAINPDRMGGSDTRLRHVVAHEICHALDIEARRRVTEPAADACAANHGFPRV